MRILSARAREIAHDRAAQRIQATVILFVENDGRQQEVRVRTSAPIHSPGGAPLKERLIASAKLILAMQADAHRPDEAEVVRPAA
jgi:hypothetical protein